MDTNAHIVYKKWTCKVLIYPYDKGGYAITLIDATDLEPTATLTRYFDKLENNEVAIDVNNCGYEVIATLKEAKILKQKDDAEKYVSSGYVNYPIYELDDKLYQVIKKTIHGAIVNE